jgi:hypothetical protein
MARRKPVDPAVKALLGWEEDAEDKEFLRSIKAITKRVCKPCWELKYCPYGPLVEDFPLPPPTRAKAKEHNAYLRRVLKSGRLGTGEELDEQRRAMFEEDLAAYDPAMYPEHIPLEVEEMGCRVFGHVCPVFFSAEGFTETTEGRRTGRYIPTHAKMRVARRDNYMCQEEGCHRALKDFEIEFDHIIPISKGGPSSETNLRVTCFEHNRSKGARITF